MRWISSEVAAAAETGAFQYQAPQAPSRMSGWAVWGQVFYFLLVFGFVIGLTYLVTRALANRTKLTRQSRHLRVIDELPLGAGRSVLLLDCVDRVLIIAASEKSVVSLGEISEAELVAQLRETREIEGASGPDFGTILQRALRPLGSVGDSPSSLADAEANAQGLRELMRRFGKQRTD